MNFFQKILKITSYLKKNENLEFTFHSISLTGDRDENQDYSNHRSFENCYAMVLADGMGGHSGGQYASKYFSDGLIQGIENNLIKIFKNPKKLMAELVLQSRKQMLAKINSIDHSLDPNTTFVVTIIGNGKLITAHLGDSRSLILSREKILSITKDHSMAQLYVDQGIIDDVEISTHPGQSKLLKAIGKDVDCDPEIKILDISPNQFPIYVLQMSDGFWQGVPINKISDEINRLENNLDNFEEIVDNLAKKAVRLTSPNSDNTTIQVCRISI